MQKRKILLDCDPGYDDAIAILLAGHAPALTLLGMTTVAGNQTLEKTTANALGLTQLLQLSVPVYAGAQAPLVRDKITAGDIHGETGLDGVRLPALAKAKEKKHAVAFLIETLLSAEEKITVVLTGPMTNMALALRLAPDITAHIREIIFMGGSIGRGNVTGAAEFNMYADPEAAHVVLTAGIPLIMVGLDVTHRAICTGDIIRRMGQYHNAAAALFCEAMENSARRQERARGVQGTPVHDAVTIAYLLEPSLLTLRKAEIAVDLSHGPSYGRTNVQTGGGTAAAGNMRVATDIDAEKLWDVIETCIRQSPV